MEKITLIFWNEFKRIFCYWTGLRYLAEKIIKPWRKYSLLTDISIEEMKNIIDKYNIKLLIIDMDGTLKHYKLGLLPRNKKWVSQVKKYVKIYIISNASKKLTSAVANELDIEYIYNARKPSTKGFKQILNLENVMGTDVIVIGDAINGDIIGSKKSGIYKNILLDDMNIIYKI